MEQTANYMLPDFPKLQCPFIRADYKVNIDDWRKYGSQLELREPKVRLVQRDIYPGYEWVFDDPDTFAVEKLNGTNIQLVTENGRLVHVQNRLNLIDPLQIIKGKTFIIEGIFMSIQKGYIKDQGIQAGEVIGPKLQGNPYQLNTHLFYPFEKAIKDLRYNSFDEHDRTFDNWSLWFKDYLVSRYYTKLFKKDELKEKIMAEGIVFYNLKRKAQGLTYMAKLRRNMFHWYYSDKIRIGERIEETEMGK